jgi:hypothetical protein
VESLSNLELCVLRWASTDFEAPHTIVANVAHDLGRSVEESEILSSFVRLTQLGLVQAFRYDAAAGQFLPVQASALPALSASAWFLAASASAR